MVSLSEATKSGALGEDSLSDGSVMCEWVASNDYQRCGFCLSE